jgi:cytochrome P450 family 4
MSKRFNNPLLHPLTIYKHTQTYQNEQKARLLAASYQGNFYQKRKDILMQSKTEKNNGKFHTFIDNLILNEDKFDGKTIRDNLVLLLLAGFETTSNETAHVLLMLAIYPKIQDKVYEEICEVFPSGGTDFDIENLNKLQYLYQVIRETMRLFPIAPHISRTPEKDIALDEYVIPAGSIIFLNLFALHRRTDFWGPEADKFNPDNFSPENAHKRHPFSFLPFSAGKRNCLGQRYAVYSMKVLLVTILREFKITTDMKFEELRFKSDVTLKLCTPHSVKLERRF